MDKLIDATMDFLYRNEDDMDEEQAEIVRYGLELFFLKASFFAATMLIGILMGSFWECLIFTALLSGIRTDGRWISCKHKNAVFYNVYAYIYKCIYYSQNC